MAKFANVGPTNPAVEIATIAIPDEDKPGRPLAFRQFI
jgi:hypothetical protein